VAGVSGTSALKDAALFYTAATLIRFGAELAGGRIAQETTGGWVGWGGWGLLWQGILYC